MKNFAVIGVSGYVAPRHLKAIKDTENNVIAALDIHDSAGILDSFFPHTQFFTNITKFNSYLNKLNKEQMEPLDFISVCTPNFLHRDHIALGLRRGANVICEKPLVIQPADLDFLERLQEKEGRDVNAIVQVRLHPTIQLLKNTINNSDQQHRAEVRLTYITARGPWYKASWKGNKNESGGLMTNIGIHLLDVLIWLFGDPKESYLHATTQTHMAGTLELARARVEWFLSIDENDLPQNDRIKGQRALRRLEIDGKPYSFDDGFTELHTLAYKDILAGQGLSIKDIRASISLAHNIGNLKVSKSANRDHIMFQNTNQSQITLFETRADTL